MRVLILISFILYTNFIVSQTFADRDYYLIDSLELNELSKADLELLETSLKKYHSAKDNINRIQALHAICQSMLNDNWIRYQFYSYMLIKKSFKDNLSSEDERSLQIYHVGALNNIGLYYQNIADNSKAMKYYQESNKISLKYSDSKGLANSFNSIGGVYYFQGDIPQALDYYHKSLAIREEINDERGVAESLNNIGFIYRKQGDVNKALEYYLKCLAIQEMLEKDHAIAISLNNIGLVYKDKGDISKALEHYNKSLLIRREIGDKMGEANSLNNIGYIYQNQNDISKALEYFQKSVAIRKSIGDKRGMAESIVNIGNTEMALGDLKSAEENGLMGLKLAKEIGSPEAILGNAELLANVYEKSGKSKDALEMYKLHITMRDSLNNEDNQKAVAKQQAKYEYEKQKALDDAEHEKQLAIEQEAKEKQKIITYSTAGGLALVALFLVFVFNRLQVTKRQKIVIQEAHHQLEEKNGEILDSIAYAKRIQTAILPPSKLVKEYLKESFILYKPKDIVAGDFYWMEHKGGKVLFAAADCTGHGVPGAMVSVICNNGLNRSVREYNLTEPGKILDKTREIVIQEFEKSEDEVKDGMDIALCSLAVSSSSGAYRELQYAGANNPLWIIRKGAKEIEEIKATKQPIGKYANPELYITHTIELQKGDSIYIFSDGYADQFGGEKGKKFKGANFKKLLLSIQNESMEKQKELINEAFENWRGELEQIDDVCVIGVKV